MDKALNKKLVESFERLRDMFMDVAKPLKEIKFKHMKELDNFTNEIILSIDNGTFTEECDIFIGEYTRISYDVRTMNGDVALDLFISILDDGKEGKELKTRFTLESKPTLRVVEDK